MSIVVVKVFKISLVVSRKFSSHHLARFTRRTQKNMSHTNDSKQFHKEEAVAEARESLKKMLKPGDCIYTILQSVSKSGMSRKIKLVVGDGENKISDITWYVSQTLEERMNDGAIVVKGCGMDMGFYLVERLSRVLFQESYALKQSWL